MIFAVAWGSNDWCTSKSVNLLLNILPGNSSLDPAVLGKDLDLRRAAKSADARRWAGHQATHSLLFFLGQGTTNQVLLIKPHDFGEISMLVDWRWLEPWTSHKAARSAAEDARAVAKASGDAWCSVSSLMLWMWAMLGVLHTNLPAKHGTSYMTWQL